MLLTRRSRLYVPIGIPGSGKTTWSDRVLVSDSVIRISTDDIRDELHSGTDYIEGRNTEVFDTFHQRIDENLGYVNVIADATNLNASARAMLVEIALRRRAEVHYVVFTNLAAAVIRNKRRKRVVPDAAMINFLAKFEEASRAIPMEPYTTITYIKDMIL